MRLVVSCLFTMVAIPAVLLVNYVAIVLAWNGHGLGFLFLGGEALMAAMCWKLLAALLTYSPPARPGPPDRARPEPRCSSR